VCSRPEEKKASEGVGALPRGSKKPVLEQTGPTQEDFREEGNPSCVCVGGHGGHLL